MQLADLDIKNTGFPLIFVNGIVRRIDYKSTKWTLSRDQKLLAR